MYAIVRQGNGKYYTSTVFGYFHDVKSQNEYERYLEQIYNPYYIVWNEEKTHLTKVFAMQQNTEYLIPQILIVDENTENWIKDKATNTGCVSFLSREIADRLCNTHEIPLEIFEKCLLLENTFSYTPISEIKTKKRHRKSCLGIRRISRCSYSNLQTFR